MVFKANLFACFTTHQTLLRLATTGDTYAIRRGAAYGVAAFVKGLSIQSLKHYGIWEAIQTHMSAAKGPSSAKEGALLITETLCDRVGRLFEPYVIAILPHLLERFGDTDVSVR